jgi:ribosomal protein L11 methyltransferase
MAIYLQIKIGDTTAEQNEILIALLSNNGYEGFEEEENFLKAFIPETDYNEEVLTAILQPFQLSFTKELLAEKNWNEEWERNFEPVLIDDFCAVRASFHPPVQNVQYEIIITPKMSFGTGHHATTYLMMKSMQVIDFKGKTVLDFGTGTGILAILAEKLGAAEVYAIDNDEWSINNGKENIENNHCHHIRIEQKDHLMDVETFDIILANINRNVLLDNMQSIADATAANGIVLLSGFYEEDIPVLMEASRKHNLLLQHTRERNKWCCVQLIKS